MPKLIHHTKLNIFQQEQLVNRMSSKFAHVSSLRKRLKDKIRRQNLRAALLLHIATFILIALYLQELVSNLYLLDANMGMLDFIKTTKYTKINPYTGNKELNTVQDVGDIPELENWMREVIVNKMLVQSTPYYTTVDGSNKRGTTPADTDPTACALAIFKCQGTSVATANANCGEQICVESEFASATATCCEAPPPPPPLPPPTTCASASFTCQGTSVATANANCGSAVCIQSEFASATASCCEAPIEWILGIRGSQMITEPAGAITTQGTITGTLINALQNCWTMAITLQGITEHAGVTVTQGSVTGTLQTELVNEWTMAITAQGITENAGVTVSQKEWTLTITAQDITHSAGVAVTQGSNTGLLKTALTGTGMTSVVVVSTTAGVAFVTTADVVIGTGGTATTVVHANVNVATNGISATGTLKTALQNEWTLVVTSQPITELAGVTVTQGSNTGILKTALTGAGMTSVVITASSGVTFVDTADVVIGSTTVLLATVTSATNTGTTTSIVVQTISGVIFVNTADLIIGSATVAFANVNTATNTGGTTNVIIHAGSGILFVTTADLIIGGTTVVNSNVITATNTADFTLGIASQSITKNQGAAVSQNEWTMAITPQAITENVGVGVTQGTSAGTLKTALLNEWTLTITAQAITESVGVAVTQGAVQGTLKTTLQNEWTLAITSQDITESEGVTVTQGVGGTAVTGTLKTALTGATTSVVLLTASGVSFVTTADLVIGSTTVPLLTVTTATNNGASTSVVILTPLGATFVTTANVVIGSTTVLLAAVTGATGTADSVVISAATGVSFGRTTVDVVIGGGGGSTVSAANIATATNTASATGTLKTALVGATTNIMITAVSPSGWATSSPKTQCGATQDEFTSLSSTVKSIEQCRESCVQDTSCSGIVTGTLSGVANTCILCTSTSTASTSTVGNSDWATYTQLFVLGGTFVSTADLVIDSAAVLHSNINSAIMNSGAATNVLMHLSSGSSLVTTANVVIGSTTLAHGTIRTTTEGVASIRYNEGGSRTNGATPFPAWSQDHGDVTHGRDVCTRYSIVDPWSVQRSFDVWRPNETAMTPFSNNGKRPVFLYLHSAGGNSNECIEDGWVEEVVGRRGGYLICMETDLTAPAQSFNWETFFVEYNPSTVNGWQIPHLLEGVALPGLTGVTSTQSASASASKCDTSRHQDVWYVRNVTSGALDHLHGVRATNTIEWTLTITSQALTKVSGVTVTQGTGAAAVTGTLKTALTGTTTNVIIITMDDVTFVTTADIIIGGGTPTTVAHATIDAASSLFIPKSPIYVVGKERGADLALIVGRCLTTTGAYHHNNNLYQNFTGIGRIHSGISTYTLRQKSWSCTPYLRDAASYSSASDSYLPGCGGGSGSDQNYLNNNGYLGCYSDPTNSVRRDLRIMKGIVPTSTSNYVTYCRTECSGYGYFGLQRTSDASDSVYECRCGGAYGTSGKILVFVFFQKAFLFLFFFLTFFFLLLLLQKKKRYGCKSKNV